MNALSRPVKPQRSALPSGYGVVQAEVRWMIGDSRRRALASVNRVLVWLYWYIGRVIVAQQAKAAWADAVVEQLSADLRAEFPDMTGLSLPNMWKMRQVFLADRRVDGWLARGKLSTVSREISAGDATPGILSTLSRELCSPELPKSILGLSWSHHTQICSASDLPDFLGLEDSHTERQLRRAMLANLRDLFLELGRDFTFAGDDYPVVAGGDTFRVDLLFFHRRLQCLMAIELKTGKFKPEYVGNCQFYLAALDEQVRLPHEKPSVGLILCKSANGVQMRLALTAAARKIGVATYQTALPEERLIRQRLRQLPDPQAPVLSSIPSDGNER